MRKKKVFFFSTLILLSIILFSFNVLASEVLISEVNYNPIGNPLDEYVEVTVRDDFGMDINTLGWYITTFDGELNYSFPDIFDFGEFDYLSIRTGSGVDDLDASDGSATIYLNLGFEILDNVGDEVALYDSGNNLIDFVRYGGGNSGIVLGNWNSGDLGPLAITGESIQIHGEDMDSSENWLSGPLTEANPNKLNMEIEDGLGTILGVEVTNGANRPVETDTEDKPRGLNYSVSRSAAVSLQEVKIIQEMMNFSFNYFKARGFNNPRLNPNGAINLTLTKTNQFSAAAGPRGTMKVDLGGNLSHLHVASFIKWNVEHEFYHLLEFEHLHANGTATQNGPFIRDPVSGGRFACLDEGAAEYWGLEISKAEFNVTETFLFNSSLNISRTYPGTFSSISYNLSVILSNFNFDLTRLGTGSGIQVYNHGYLLNKYIAETYGQQKLVHIHNITRNNRTGTGGNLVGSDAVEKAFKDEGINLTFSQLWGNWREWIYLTYGNNITFTTVREFNGSNIGEVGTLRRWETSYEIYNVNTSIPFNISIGGSTTGNYSISTIIEYKNGTRVVVRNTFTGTGLGNRSVNNFITSPGNITRIVLVKTKIDDQPFLFSYNVTFRRMNTAPNITNSTPQNRSLRVFRNTNNTFSVTARDAENDTLTYNWTLNGTQVAFSSPNFTLITNKTGNFTLRVLVSDGFGGAANTSWNISLINRAPNITNSTPVNKTLVLIKNSTTIFSVNAADPDNDTLTYNWTVNGTQVAFSTPNFTFISNRTGNFTVSVLVKDSLGANTSTSWNVSVVINRTLNLRRGWNLIAPLLEPFLFGNKSINFTKGWNLFGYSGDDPFLWRNAVFRNASGSVKNASDAQTAGWIQATIYYYDADSQIYKTVSLSGAGENNLRKARGHWIYSSQQLTVTMPNIEGSLVSSTYPWLNSRISKEGVEKSIADAQTSRWIQGTIYVFNDSEQKYNLVPGNGGNNIQGWKGYWIYAFEDNMTLTT